MRSFRIMLALVMLFASLLWLLLGSGAPVYAVVAKDAQIIPSAIQSTLGVTVMWIIATLLFGRIYCATVCPVGTLQDIVIWSRRKLDRKFTFRYENPKRIWLIILIIYFASLIAGIWAVAYLIEPWNIMLSAASTVRPDDTKATWGAVGVSVGTGAAAGIIALAGILVWAWKSGRRFCTSVCPIGTSLGCLHSQALMNIAIDPDSCVSCMKCEDVCPSKCIKVADRYVDNSRCVRCFDCTAVCPNDAIRFQLNRNRNRQTPLMEPNA